MQRQAYEYLNSVRVFHWQWLKLKAKHDELESCLLPQGIRYDKDRVQTSPDDNVSRIIAEIADLEHKMKVIQNVKAKRIEDIYGKLEGLPCDEWKTALAMRFINRKTVADIAIEMGYAESTIYKFMDKGAEHLIKNKSV